MGKRISTEDAKNICKLYAEGKSTVEIGRIYKKSPTTIRQSLLRNGVQLRSIKEARGSISEKEHKKISELYLGGESLASIARTYGCTSGPIRKIIESLGIENRRGRRFTCEQRNQIIETYKKGATIKEVAIMHDCVESMIYAIIDEASLERRGRNNLSESEEKEICQRYLKGETQSSLTRSYGLKSDGVVSRILEKNKITKRDPINEQRKLSAIEEAQVVGKYTAGDSSTKLAEEFKVSSATIFNILQRHGIERRTNVETLGWGISRDQYEEVAKLYTEEEKTTHEIAEIYNCSYDHICKVLERLGIEKRTYYALDPEQHQKVVDEYIDGKSSYQIARKYDVSVQWVCNLLERNSVDRRDPGTAGDSVQKAIEGTGNFEHPQETDYYIYSVAEFERHYKPGISFSRKDRIRGRSEFYGDEEYLQIYPTRRDAYFIEQAILEATKKKMPKDSNASFYRFEGSGEVREIDLNELLEIVNWYNQELERLGIWEFAATHVPMTDQQRTHCKRLSGK